MHTNHESVPPQTQATMPHNLSSDISVTVTDSGAFGKYEGFSVCILFLISKLECII